MEQLFIGLLGNSPTLIAVLLVWTHYDKRCSLIEQQIFNLKGKRYGKT